VIGSTRFVRAWASAAAAAWICGYPAIAACAESSAPAVQRTPREEAIRWGREQSAAGLEGVIAADNEYLLEAYAAGFRETVARLRSSGERATLPIAIEALVVKHYADPRLGPPLKGLLVGDGYSSRALFDLRLADWRRARARGQDFEGRHAVLLTTAPGIEDALAGWMQAPDRPTGSDAFAIARVLVKRGHAEALPVVIAMLEDPAAREIPTLASLALEAGGRSAVPAVLKRAGALVRTPATANDAQTILARILELESQDLPSFAAFRAALPERMNDAQKHLLVRLVQQRADPEGESEMIAMLADPGVSYGAVGAILALDSPDSWRRAREEVERLWTAKVSDETRYRTQSALLDAKLADPARHFAQKKAAARSGELKGRRDAIEKESATIAGLRESDPKKYLEASETRLGRLVDLAREFDDVGNDKTSLRVDVALRYLRLAHFARFRLHDARRALDLYRLAEESGSPFGALGLADTHQFDLRDKASALREYRRLAELLRTRPEPETDFESGIQQWAMRWAAHQVAYLETGRRFSGTLRSEDIAEFWAGQAFGWGARGDVADLGVPPLRGMVTPAMQDARVPQAPRSIFTLIDMGVAMAKMQDAGQLIGELERVDPAGFASACLLVTAEHFPHGPGFAEAVKRHFAARRIRIETSPEGSAPRNRP